MAGGLIEGLKKCYCGKNVLQKHIIIFLFCFLLTLPTAIAQSHLGINAKEAEIYGYLFKSPILLILLIVMTIVLTLYLINFTHNALKFFIWRDTQEDPAKIEAIQIMPEINKQLFSYFGSYLGFTVCWALSYFLIIVILAIITSQIPVLGVIGIIIVCFSGLISIPYILVGFAKNYKIKGNISPLLLFTYAKGTILSTLFLYLKTLGLSILLGLGLFILCFIIGIIAGILGFNQEIFNQVFFLSFASTIFAYISMLIYFAFYYSAAYIYNNKIGNK